MTSSSITALNFLGVVGRVQVGGAGDLRCRAAAAGRSRGWVEVEAVGWLRVRPRRRRLQAAVIGGEAGGGFRVPTTFLLVHHQTYRPAC